MFKKRTKKPKAQTVQRRRSSSDDESEDDNVQQKLESTKKRRKLLHDMQYKKGVNTDDLLKKQSSKPEQAESETSALPDNVATEQSQKVWEQKHQSAMEAFVNKQLQQQQQQDDADKSQHTKEKATTTTTITTQDDLYRAMAERAAELSGPTEHATGLEELNAGAAVAMAEVVLPSQSKTTTSSNNNNNNKHSSRLPVNVLNRNHISTRPPPPTEPAVDDHRAGFAATRTQTKHPSGSRYQPNVDDRAYKQFVKRQRERGKL